MNHFFAKTMLAAGVVMMVAASAAPAHAFCTPGFGNVTIGTEVVKTTSTIFTDVPKTTTDFTLGLKSCVFVHFSAETFAPSNAVILVQVVLDGVTVARPGPITWVASNDSPISSAQSFEFFLGTVTAGAHSAKVQWRSQNGNEIQFTNRILTINHR
jgi:hypothetical protein